MESLPALFGPPNENPGEKTMSGSSETNIHFTQVFPEVEKISNGKAILKEEERSFSESLQESSDGRQDLMWKVVFFFW